MIVIFIMIAILLHNVDVTKIMAEDIAIFFCSKVFRTIVLYYWLFYWF